MNKSECIVLFPASYQAGIRNMLAVIASTDEARNGRARYSGTMSQFQAGLNADTALQQAEHAATNPVGERDYRPVGMDASGEVISVYELWNAAIRQLRYEAATNRQNWERVAKLAAEADDAQQCADDLGIRHGWMKHDECVTELERVGLGGLIDAADLARQSMFRGLGPA